MPKAIYVNLPVADLKRSMVFFEALGFSFNQQFTNDDAACLVISETIFAMLHTPHMLHMLHMLHMPDSWLHVRARLQGPRWPVF
jgi:predicted lactoylglutathione lyase